MRGLRDRPSGLAPRGTVWGLAAVMLIALMAPPSAILVASPWLPFSLDGLLGFMFGSIFAAFVPVTVLIVGQSSRRYWGVCCFFYGGLACLALTVAAAAMALVVPLGLARSWHADYTGLVYMGWLLLVVCVVMCWPLTLALRLSYWQPWAPPETWEVGDERNARWANRLTGRNNTL